MKKLGLMAVAAVTAFSPILAAPAYADPPRHHDRDGRWDDRRDDRRGDRYDRRDDRRDDRRHYRDGYREGRWEAGRHNGYSYNGRWFYGPPPSAYYGRAGFEPGYRAWRRGDRVPAYYRDRYVVVRDYNRYGYRAPPRGYHYVRDDRGDVLLVGIATGVILSAILSH